MTVCLHCRQSDSASGTGGTRERKKSGEAAGNSANPFLSDRNADGKVISTASNSKQRMTAARHLAGSAGPDWGIVRVGVVLLSLVLSAGLLSIEIGSRSHPWFAWFTLLPLLAVIRIAPPRQAFAYGALWGGSLFAFLALTGNALVPPTFQSFALLSVVPGLYAMSAALVTRRFGFNPLILGFGWSGVELALFPLGLKAGLLAVAAGHEVGSFIHILENVVGYVCMASFIVAVNGVLLGMLRHACIAGASLRRYVRGSSSSQRRFFPLEVPAYLFFFTNPAQPRAPPIV